MERTVEQWFQDYGDSHQNATNKLIHWFCVPLITFCVIGLLWSLNHWLAAGFMVLSFLFYLRLSVALAMAMIVVAGVMMTVIVGLERQGVLLPVSLVVFVASWIGQFIGHYIEGKKPSFFKDLQFLLIGPLWVLGFLFRKMNIRY